jgi:predicted NAD/FAD-binding protein
MAVSRDQQLHRDGRDQQLHILSAATSTSTWLSAATSISTVTAVMEAAPPQRQAAHSTGSSGAQQRLQWRSVIIGYCSRLSHGALAPKTAACKARARRAETVAPAVPACAAAAT